MTNQWEPSTLNAAGREQAWLRSVVDSHDSFCGCHDPGFHLGLLLHAGGRHQGGHGGPQPPPPPRGPGLGRGADDLPRFLPLPGLPPAPEEPPHSRPPCPGGPAEDGGGAAADAETGEVEWRPEDIAELLDGLDDAERG